jgi:DNA repair exonuclease SbcCD nuclease subunit
MEAHCMSSDIVRFLHASELRLGAPLFGVADLPPKLREAMIDARYRAAERVFDVALAEGVDFVVLSGGVLSDAAAGPRGLWFFAEQAARLAERKIAVYWAEELTGGRRWADYVPLPKNVYQLDPQVRQTYDFARDCRVVAKIMTESPLGQDAPRHDAITICLLPEGLEGLPLSPAPVDYWALGGRSEPGAVPAVNGLAQFAGSPQGHSPSEGGPRGCMLVEATRERQLTSRFVSTEVIRWHQERVAVDEGMNWQKLRADLHARREAIGRSSGCEAALVRWTLTGHGTVWQQLLRDDVCERLLNDLRKQGSAGSPPVWSLLIDAAPDEAQVLAWSREGSPFAAAAHALCRPSETAVTGESAAIVDTRRGIHEPHFGSRVRQRAVRTAARRLPGLKTEVLSPH